MKRRRIALQWESYRSAVIPKSAPDVQITETRLAFYAGARALMTMLVDGVSAGPDAQPDDLHMMEEIEQELADFLAEHKRSHG